MKFMSWNVNGLRAALRHGFVNTFTDLDADIFAIQDTRVEANEVQIDLPGYYPVSYTHLTLPTKLEV